MLMCFEIHMAVTGAAPRRAMLCWLMPGWAVHQWGPWVAASWQQRQPAGMLAPALLPLGPLLGLALPPTPELRLDT